MKKTLIPILALSLTAGLTFNSCGSGDAETANDTVVAQTTIDSLSQAYGKLMGAYFNKSICDTERTDSTIVINRQDFIKGMQLVLSDDYSEDFFAGVMAGVQIQKDLKNYANQGTALNRQEILNLVRNLVLQDSVDEKSYKAYQDTMMKLQESLNKTLERREVERAKATPKAQANYNAGQAIADKAVQAGATRTASGLVANIQNPGSGKIDPNKRYLVNISLKHIDGKTINAGDAVQILPNQQFKGVQEALGLIGIGGKGTFYLTPELGFGILGMPEMDIEPQEWTILDIEIIGEADSTPPSLPIQTEPATNIQ